MLMCGIMVVIIGVCEMKVVKNNIHHYYISLLVFLLGLGLIPAGLMTSGVFAETEQATDRAPEVTEISRTEAEVSVSQIEIANIEESFQTDYVEPTPVQQVADQINIAGNTVPIFYSSSTSINAGNQVGLFRGRFLYGHNSANVFGGLQYLPIGATFTVTLGGVTKNYQIVNRVVLSFEEQASNPNYTTSNRYIWDAATLNMADVAAGMFKGVKYDYTIMTCHGDVQRKDGNGTTKRLVLMANEI